MRIAILTTLATALLAAPAIAQGGTTQTPPATESSESAPQPSNSLPAGSGTVPQSVPSTGIVGSTNGGASPSGSVQGSPAAPNGSTGDQPSGAFEKTVPTPAK